MFELPQDYHLNYTKSNDYIKSIENNFQKLERSIAQHAQNHKDQISSIIKTDRNIIKHFFAFSPYLADLVIKHPHLILEIAEHGYDAIFNDTMQNILFDKITPITNTNFYKELRIAKQKISLLIAMADMTKEWNLEKVTLSLSLFAEQCLKVSTQYLLHEASLNNEIIIEDKKSPEDNSGIIILAMGKLGAHELNYSSDIDIIIFFDEQRCNYIGRKTIKHFAINFANKLAKTLSERTQDGYVFRTDLRLRPDPISNPVAVSLTSAENYYENLGQNWERAAMIKARHVAGDTESYTKFYDFMRYFVWRKSLDFASIQDIHSIKRQIDHRLNEKAETFLAYNVKLGKGGIREIEFFCQTQQLIWGGRKTEIQQKATCNAINALVEIQQVKPTTALLMIDAYAFLRKTEHRLQMLEDQQTHTLPNNPEDYEKLADFMGFEMPEILTGLLQQKTYSVRHHYSQLFETAPSLANSQKAYGNLVFTGADDDPETLKTLKKMGFKSPSVIANTIRGWHHGRRRATRTKNAREILTELVPTLLDSFSNGAYPDKSFKNFDEFLDRIPSGLQIFSLFYSNPGLLNILVEILGMYPYLTHNLNRQPSLLDYVLAPDFYYSLPNKKELEQELSTLLEPAKDLEDALDITHNWTNDRRFRVAVQYIKSYIDHNTTAENLSDIADVSTSGLMDLIYDNFQKRYGIIKNSNFAILAFGKLGGQELTFNSDLDLVFLYRSNEVTSIGGETSLDTNTYFTRLARRFTTYVSTMTRGGSLYDIDLRLRPSGNDGPVASSFAAFIKYYNDSAWMWEYMALTKTRCIYSRKNNDGSNFVEDIDNKIREILCTPHTHHKLIDEIIKMHKKTVTIKTTDNPLNLKYHRGGAMDIEYITQTLLLLYAPTHQEILSHNTTNALYKLIKILPNEKEKFEQLIEAYGFYRALLSYLRLTGNNRPRENELTIIEKKLLAHHTQEKDFKSLQKKLITTQATVEEIFDYFMKQDI